MKRNGFGAGRKRGRKRGQATLWPEISGLAGKGRPILFAAVAAADASKAVTEDSTLEKALDLLLNDRTNGAVVFLIEGTVALLELLPVMVQTLIERTFPRTTWPVDRRSCHHLQRTSEHREMNDGFQRTTSSSPFDARPMWEALGTERAEVVRGPASVYFRHRCDGRGGQPHPAAASFDRGRRVRDAGGDIR